MLLVLFSTAAVFLGLSLGMVFTAYITVRNLRNGIKPKYLKQFDIRFYPKKKGGE